MNRSALTVIGSALLTLASQVGAGVVTTFTAGSNSYWSTPGNWDHGVPGANDRAVIPSTETCIINTSVTAYADTIEVQAGGGNSGTLEISYNSSLTLYNATDNISPTGADNSLIDGSVVLDVSGGTGAALIFQGDHILAGIGKVRGVLSAAIPKIAIGPWKLVKNQLYSSDGSSGIIGSLTITDTGSLTPGTPRFKNDGGTVSAGYASQHGHQIVMSSTVDLDDTSSSLWYVTTCKGGMTFNRPTTTLSGDFGIDASNPGWFQINQNIKTCGTFQLSGKINIVSGATLSTPRSRPRPCALIRGPGARCSTPWTLSGGSSYGCAFCE
jgi:hypothetical protein